MRTIVLYKPQMYDNEIRRVVLNDADIDILFVQYNQQLYIFKNNCPHQNLPLHKATVKNGLIMCPWHGMQFSVQYQGALLPKWLPVSGQKMYKTLKRVTNTPHLCLHQYAYSEINNMLTIYIDQT